MALLKWPKPGANGSQARDPEGRMPLMDHLRELRNRLVIAVLALVVGTVLGFLVFDPVWDFLKAPFCETSAAQQLRPGECSLAIGGIFQSFFLTLHVAAMVGVVASSPVWLYQVWAFVTPGLYRNERRYTFSFLGLAVPLFLAGAILAYLVMDTSLSILLSFAPESGVPLIQIDEYLSYTMIMLLVFGVSFELPLLMVFLNIIGVLPRATVKKHRRMVIFLMFVFGAVATPGGEPLTMIALALPMVGLFGLAEVFMYLREKRQPVAEDYSGLSDDEASPLDVDSDGGADDDSDLRR
ncbi:twin-arginine translocase subunit TatC [Spongiactinospora sp. TRM90649]|uniref:twin-arginine translocase subunit TatC n=1 Tax=Spongiactinospora sp. TRM90649 TaxID=3031114 RepID=UPI0023F9BE17|nr:twin-arginine translocase subunit TatC [Spongiactinospora sp. TRM90649]MDF5753838.1 twin-arginine translocase subunit TatC [Spongiactinospora sp. TRM90649]